MAKPAARIAALQAVLAIGALSIVARSFVVQVVQYRAWHDRATALRTAQRSVPATRGTIYDRNGTPLVATQTYYRLNITRDNLKDTTFVQIRQLLLAAGVTRERIDKAFQKNYVYIPNLLTAEQLEPFRNLAGVAWDKELRRVYPLQHLAGPWLGTLSDSGRATGGIERALDTVLTGVPGRDMYLKDGDGFPREVPDSRLQDPIPGHDVYLTIDSELQGIVEGELLNTIHDNKARGGDIVVLDVHTGEILAVASFRKDSLTGDLVPTTSAAVEPNEPGSTSKIFTAAALLRTGKDTQAVPGHGGVYTVPGTDRVIKDVHPENGMLTLGETIKVSSNVAISQFSLRLSPEEQYATLRDFGFGTPLGLMIPESSGGLFELPARSELLTKPSVAQGYEWMTTAIQLATGYAAIANNGLLMSPSLVREVRTSNRELLWQNKPSPVRQSVTPAVAAQLRAYLKLVTDSGGSGTRAQLDRYTVIGKTGTAKVLLPNRHYQVGVYRASFAGMFPGDDPQIAIYVMIDRPTGGEIYGGLVAAPVVRTILLQALAVQRSPLDRSRLESTVAAIPVTPPRHPGSDSVFGVTIPMANKTPTNANAVAIPELTGLSVREAVASLHQLGLRVHLSGAGRVTSLSPAPGESVPRGTAIVVQAKSFP